MKQTRNKKGRFEFANGKRYRKSDIESAFIAGLNDTRGLSLPSQKLKTYLIKEGIK